MKHLLLFYLFIFSTSLYANTILVMGDSLSAGYGLNEGEAWPSLLQQKLINTPQLKKYHVVNASVSGETSEGGFLRFADLLTKHTPYLVILELGANDGLRGQPLPQMHQNLAQMITLSQQQHSKVLLLGVRIPPNYGTRYSTAFHQVYFDLQQQYSVSLVPFFLENIAGNTNLMQADGLHPTAEAQAIIVENIWKSMVALLQ